MTKTFEIYIRTTAERLWDAITDPVQRAKYSFGIAVVSDWTPGSRFEISGQEGTVLAEGENVEVDPPRRLVQRMAALWGEDVKEEGESRVAWDIHPLGDACRLVVTHDQLREKASEELYRGWPLVLSGLKTLLETGEQLATPGSPLYLEGSRTSGLLGSTAQPLADPMPGASDA